jgi:hypothetical protein
MVMQSLAAFIMRGRIYAMLAVLAASMLPLLGWFGAAVLALVALRRGLSEGLLVAAGAGAALAVLYQLLTGMPQLVLRPVVELWLPVLLLAFWLRRTVSLSSTLRLAAALGAAGVLALYLAYPDQQAFWQPLLERTEQAVAGSPESSDAWAAFTERFAPVLTGLWVLSIEATVVLALLMGRWLQSLLYYPGGFRREFHGLNLGRPMAVAVAVLLLAAVFAGHGVVYDLALVAGGAFALQALALAHATVAAKGRSRGWLLALYVLLPLLFELMVVVGIADAAFDWRRRLLARSGGNDSA